MRIGAVFSQADSGTDPVAIRQWAIDAEAAELAYNGAKVLHPRALIPVAGRQVPVFVRPFAEPTAYSQKSGKAIVESQ